jgi:Transposase DDE domain
LWRLLSNGNFWFYPRFAVSDQAVYKRLEEGGTIPLQRLFAQVRSVLAQRLAPFEEKGLAPFATQVLALDETTLDGVARLLPALRTVPAGNKALLPGKLAALFNLRCQQWERIQHIEDPHQNSKVAARSMLEEVPKGSLVLVDLGYFGFELFDWLTQSRLWWVSRMRERTSYQVLHTFYESADQAGNTCLFDGLVWLGTYRADQAAYAVRLVRFRVGNTEYRYITNVLDPTCFTIAQLARLYARRWDIELAFKLVKRHLGLHMLWSAKDVVVQQQVWAVLIISQILQGLRMEIAGRAEVDTYEVSMGLLVRYLPQYAYTGEDPVQVFVERGRALRFIRPSTRTKVVAPAVDPKQLVPVPPDLALIRPPRYAHRNCAPRSVLRN